MNSTVQYNLNSFTISSMANILEDPLVVAEQIDLFQVHLPQQKLFLIPNQCVTPNDNA